MVARNIAQQYAIFFFVLNSVTLPPQHMENFSRPLEVMRRQQHKLFAGTMRFLKAETLLKMSSTVDDHQQHGQRQSSTGKKTSSIRSKFDSQSAC